MKKMAEELHKGEESKQLTDLENNDQSVFSLSQACFYHTFRQNINIDNPTVSAETRKLMEQVLASKANEDEMSSRVATLLAGTSLTTTKGFKGDGRQVDMVEYNGGKQKSN